MFSSPWYQLVSGFPSDTFLWGFFFLLVFLPPVVLVGSLNLDVRDRGYKRLAVHTSVRGPHDLFLTSSIPGDSSQALARSLQGTEMRLLSFVPKLPQDLTKLESLSEKGWNTQGSAWPTFPAGLRQQPNHNFHFLKIDGNYAALHQANEELYTFLHLRKHESPFILECLRRQPSYSGKVFFLEWYIFLSACIEEMKGVHPQPIG